MPKGTQRARNQTITDKLTLGVNAIVRRKVGNGYDILFPKALDILVLTSAHTVTPQQSGMRFILNSATGFIVTLPLPAAALEYSFYIGATEPTTSHTVVTNGSNNIINGTVGSSDLNSASDVATVADADTITFTSSAIHGDFVSVWSDGTHWYVNGLCTAQAAITTTQFS